MMPGVVAGFPRQAVIGELVSANSGLFFGYTRTGASGAGVYIGALDPAGFNLVPGALPVVGGEGEILDLAYYSLNEHVFLTVRGDYPNAAAVPFTSITVNGRTFAKANATDLGMWGGGRSLRWNSSTNPFPVGRHVITVS